MEAAASGALRYATRRDIAHVIELARLEHAASSWAERGVPFSPVAVADTMAAFIETPGRTAFVTDGGYFFGLVQPMGFTTALAAMEYAWFARDGSGLMLLRAFDEWARRMGADVVVVNDMGGGNGRLAAVLTRRYGFNTLGTTLVRRPGISKG